MAGRVHMRSTDRKNSKKFPGTIYYIKRVTTNHRTDKGTAFTGKEFREICKSLNIKLIYGTPYIHTPTGLVERGIRTLKEHLRTNLEEGYNINEALSRSLNVMRTTIHSSKKRNTVRTLLWQKTTNGNS